MGAGISYPEKYIFVSPSKASTTVFTKNLEVRINGVAHIGSQDIEYDRSFTSSAIVLKPNYLYSESVELVYEHSAVLLKYGSAVVARSGQESFSPDAMNLYIVNASFDSFATTEEVTFAIHPVSYGNAVSFNGTVEFECYDEATAKWWEETLGRFYDLKRDGARIEINFSGSLSINYVKVYASPKGEVREGETPKPRHIVPILNNSTTYNLLAGQTWDFGVLVLDEYLNPIRDTKILYNESVISISIEGSCGNVGKCTKHVKAGEVWCSFSSPIPCSGRVNFTLLDPESVEYEISVGYGAVSGEITVDLDSPNQMEENKSYEVVVRVRNLKGVEESLDVELAAKNDTSELRIGSRRVELSPGEEEDVIFYLKPSDAGIGPGNWTLEATADTASDSEEVEIVRDGEGLPDFSIVRLDAPSQMVEGREYNFSVKVGNHGAAAASVKIALFLENGESVKIGEETINLDPTTYTGRYGIAEFSWKVPRGFQTGEWLLKAVTDPYGEIAEYDETNNVSQKFVEILEATEKPDLTVSITSYPSRVERGGSYSIEVEVHNAGNEAAEDFPVRITVERSGDVREVGEIRIDSLDPGAYEARTISWSVPYDMGIGNWTLKAEVDPYDDVLEKDETNNADIKTVEVTPGPPDLAVLDIKVSNLKIKGNEIALKGVTSGVSVEIVNYGDDAASFNVTLVLKGSVTLTLTETVDRLGRGETREVRFDFEWSEAGKWDLKATVDPENAVEESNEDNNYREESAYSVECINLTVDGSKIDEDLSSFPVTVFLNEQRAGELFDNVYLDYKKILVTDGERMSYVEVERWDADSKEAILHFEADLPANQDKTFYLCYCIDLPDNDEYVGATGSAAASRVWSGYVGVWHMSGYSEIVDSTLNNNGTKLSPMHPREVSGIVGSAQEYVEGDYVKVPSSDELNLSTLTLEAWLKPAGSVLKMRPITITGSSEELRDYQVKIVVPRDDDMRADFGDLRFYDANGNELPYWIESYDSEKAIVWVKVPRIPTSGTTIYMYYGNPNAESKSNGSAVFDFFDDFDNGLNETKWTRVSDATVENGYFRGNGGNEKTWARSTKTFEAPFIVEFVMKPEKSGDFDSGIRVGNIYFISDYGPGTPCIRTSRCYPSGSQGLAWHRYTVIVQAGEQTFIDETAGKQVTARYSYESGYLYLVGDSDNSGRDTFYDWVRVRKYAESEPSASIGNEEEIVALTVWVNSRSITYYTAKQMWVYLVQTYDGSTQKLFINGSLAKSSSPSESVRVTGDPLYIGVNYTGTIDEVRLSSVPRSEAWIKATYYSLTDNLLSYS